MERPVLAPRGLRVDRDALDHILQLIDDVGRARDELLRVTALADSIERMRVIGRWSRMVGELYDRVKQLRRRPIGDLWRRVPRMVRDAATRCGKRVRLEMDGDGDRPRCRTARRAARAAPAPRAE